MNWKEAKTIIIILLILVNTFLFFVNSRNNNYTLSYENKKSIIDLLKENNIEICVDLPTDYSPMVMMEISTNHIDLTTLKQIFFSNDIVVKRSVEFGTTIFKTDEKNLTLDNNLFKYINKGSNNIPLTDFSRKSATSEALAILNRLFNKKAEYTLEQIELVNEKYLIDFFEKKYGYNFYDCYASFEISTKGVESFEMEAHSIKKIYGSARNICSADEALLTFLYSLKNINYKNIIISSMELGYKFEKSISDGTVGRAVPCYRIYAKGIDKVVYVNAYTNTIME